MTTQNAVMDTLVQGCARFLKNIALYKRDSDGQYRNAWTGDAVRVRISPAEFERLEKLMGGSEKEISLQGRHLGTIELWAPYAYPCLFLVLHLEEKYQDNPTVVRRLGFMGGHREAVDPALLTITRPIPDTAGLGF